MNFKNKLLIGIILLFAVLSMNLFAAEPIAKEETNPPSAEGPLDVNQIPMINKMGKPVKQVSLNNDNYFSQLYSAN